MVMEMIPFLFGFAAACVLPWRWSIAGFVVVCGFIWAAAMGELGGSLLTASLSVAVDSAAAGAGFIACRMIRLQALVKR